MSSFEDSFYTRPTFSRPDRYQSKVVTWTSVLAAAASRQLPLLDHKYFRPIRHLGHGTSYSVSGGIWEPTNVNIITGTSVLHSQVIAVKYIFPDRLRHGAASSTMMREIRILTHPPLRRHPNILQLFGYGWKNQYFDASAATGLIGERGNLYPCPYIAVELLDEGSLREFCRSIANQPSTEAKWRTLQLLALDVAAALAALHECGVVHGDVKIDNVLVVKSKLSPQKYVAKVADFGASLFEEEVRHGAFYKGTPIYNPPELYGVEEWLYDDRAEEIDFLETAHVRADVYSYGLLLWEILKDGDLYIDRALLHPNENDNLVEFLVRIYEESKEAVLNLAEDFLSTLKMQEPLRKITLAVLRGSLRRRAAERHAMKEIVGTLFIEEPNRKGSSLRSDAPYYSLAERSSVSSRPDYTKSSQARDDTLEDLSNLTLDEKIYRTKLENWPGVTMTLNDLWVRERRVDLPKTEVTDTGEGNHVATLSMPRGSSHNLDHVAISNVRHEEYTSKSQPQAHGRTSRPEHTDWPLVRSTVITSEGESSYYTHAPPLRSDIFTTIRYGNAPWEIQTYMIKELQEKTRFKESDPCGAAEANLQLGVCYYSGFGVVPSVPTALRYIRMAAENNSAAAEILKWVEPILTNSNLEASPEADTRPSFLSLLRNYHRRNAVSESDHSFVHNGCEYNFQDRQSLREMIREHCWGAMYTPLYVHVRVPFPSTHLEKTLLFHQAAKVGDLTIIKTIIARIPNRLTRDESHALAMGLNLACEYGNFQVAKYLSTWCEYVPDGRGIFPLHWLFVFDAEEAQELAQLLIRSDTPNRLNSVPVYEASEGKAVLLLQGTCTEFFGTPLHWAVRARAPHVAKILLDLGADVNYRVESISALDIAVCFHLPEIVSLLLDYGAEFVNSDDGQSALHKFSELALPFSKHIIHGLSYRQSLRDTLEILLDRGNEIDVVDKTGDTPLLLACTSYMDDEVYIIEELLKRGVKERHKNMSYETVFTMAASALYRRRFNIARLKFLLETVDVDVNYETCWNHTALHYCVITDSTYGLNLLRKLPQVSLSSVCRSLSLKGMTPLHIAAYLGSFGCLEILIAAKAPLEAKDANDATPLELATTKRNPREMTRLLNAGAEFIFGNILTRRTYTTALHASVANADTPASVTGKLLQHRRIRQHSCINYFDYTGLTALHKAAYFGDIQSVADLLDAKANPRIKSKAWADYPNFTPLELVTFLLDQGILPNDCKRFELKDERFGQSVGWLGLKVLLEEVRIILKEHMEDMDSYTIVEESSSETSSSHSDTVVISK